MSAGSEKWKLNADSSTVAEAVGTEQFLPRIIFVASLLALIENIVHQDNESSVLLEKNGKSSSSERTRAANVRFFEMKDCIDKKELILSHCLVHDVLKLHDKRPGRPQVQ